MTYRLQLFGLVSLTRDGRPVMSAAAQRHSVALLAVLAAHEPRGISREKLGALLWPESSEEHARNSLKQVLHVVRRELGSSAVLGVGALRIGLDAVACDLAEFEQQCAATELTRAVATYGGPFLDGFRLGGSSEGFDGWADGERARLARRFSEVLDELAMQAEQRGDMRSALGWWRALERHEPLNGRSARGIIESLAAVGDRAGAVQHGEWFRARIMAEMGLPLDAEFEALLAAVHAGAPMRAPIVEEAGGVAHDQERQPGARTPAHASASGPIALPRRSLPRNVMLTAGSIVASLSVLLLLARCGEALAPVAYDPRRVVVASVGGAGDAAGVGVRRLVAEGIAEELASASIATPTMVLSEPERDPGTTAARAGAGLLVTVQAAPGTGGTLVSAQVTDVASGQRRWSSPQTLIPVGGDGEAAALAERTATAVAVRLDARMSSWIGHASQPSTLAAYREFRLGLDRYADFEPQDAYPHFVAAAKDTAFTMALVMSSWASFYAVGLVPAPADSLARVLAVRPLAPLDRALVEYLLAVTRHDFGAAYELAHTIVAVAPNSPWRIFLAHAAIDVGRAREAARVLDELGPDDGWMMPSYWNTASRTLHLLGEHERELAVMRDGVRRRPLDRIMVQYLIKALAATGRVAEVEAQVDRSLALKQKAVWNDMQPMEQAVLELRAHGHRASAQRVAARTLDWLDHFPLAKPEREDELHAELLVEAGRTAEGLALYARLTAGPNPDWGSLVEYAVYSAELGDRATARRLQARYERFTGRAPENSDYIGRARIAASLGDREAAVRLLGDAYREGFSWRSALHVFPGFEVLKGYAPFDSLMGSVD